MSTGKKFICVRTQFTALHCWPFAPDEVKFLRNPHRHVFYVTVTIPVTHGDRVYEFFMVKRDLDHIIQTSVLNPDNHLAAVGPSAGEDDVVKHTLTASCEDIAEYIAKVFGAMYPVAQVTVSEDNENTGIYQLW